MTHQACPGDGERGGPESEPGSVDECDDPMNEQDEGAPEGWAIDPEALFDYFLTDTYEELRSLGNLQVSPGMARARVVVLCGAVDTLLRLVPVILPIEGEQGDGADAGAGAV